MPSTSPSSVWVESSESRYGIRIEKISEAPSGVPRVKMEKLAELMVSYEPSAAAIFIGWASTIASES